MIANMNFMDCTDGPADAETQRASDLFFALAEARVANRVIINDPIDFDKFVDMLYFAPFSLVDEEGYVLDDGERKQSLAAKKPGQYLVGHCPAHGDFDGDQNDRCPTCNTFVC